MGWRLLGGTKKGSANDAITDHGVRDKSKYTYSWSYRYGL